MSQPKMNLTECLDCGGNLRPDGVCNICELLGTGSAALSVVGGTQTTGWPMVMGDSLGVHPSQVDAANARVKRHGINVVYDKQGNPHVPDRNERAKLLKLERMHDKRSFTNS